MKERQLGRLVAGSVLVMACVTAVQTGGTASAGESTSADLHMDMSLKGPSLVGHVAKWRRFAPPPADVPAGGQATYTLEVSNAGPSDAADVTVIDKLPANLTFVSSPGGECTASGQTITCTSSSALPAGEKKTFKVIVKVNPSTADGTTLTNDANASSSTTDPTPDNNKDSADINVKAVTDVTVKKTTPAAAVIAGGATFDVTLEAESKGPSDSAQVKIKDRIDVTRFEFVATGSDSTCTFTSPTVTCDLGTVPAGTKKSVVIKLKAKAATPPGSYDNTATVSTTTTESDTDNNSSTSPIKVDANADLSLKKTVVATAP